MGLTPGSRLGPYEVMTVLGAGGMGEVYRARDARLGRDVAIKVLPARFLVDAEARARFEREARAVAALSHPNILAIHDVGEHDGAAYAVTELLDGETLAERLASGPLPVRKALDLARQMADGLAAAHDKGIVHRDLKPGNIFLTRDGRLKILDFGLAKSAPRQGEGTQTLALATSTEPGTVLGTVHYMSPEQVRAGDVDHRSDIFSFGCVLYQMLTASQPFTADSAVETMNAILREEPRDTVSVNPSVPPSVDRIVQRCLEKKPEQRFQSARDLAFALGNTGDSSSSRTSLSPPEAAAAPAAARARLRPLLAAAGLLLLGGLVGALLASRMRSAAAFEPVKITPLTHSGHDWAPSASPDGRMLAFASSRDGKTRIWLREMKGGNEVPLTEGSDISPRFSPDGSSILFLRGAGALRSVWRIPVVGGQARKLLDDVSEAVWSPDGTRLAFLRPTGEVPAAAMFLGISSIQGGDERQLARIDGRTLYGLAWSPDGKWLSVAAGPIANNTPKNSILVFDAGTGAIRTSVDFTERLSFASWDRAGRTLVLAQSTSILGDVSNPIGRVLRLDPFSGRRRAVFWVQSVNPGGVDVVRFDSVSDDAFVFDDYTWRGSLEEIELTGPPPFSNGRLLTQGNSRDRQPAYARSGDLILFSTNRSGNLDLWTTNTKTGEVRQITDDMAEDWDPGFTADGRGIIWSSSRSGNLEIWGAGVDGTGAHQITHDGVDAENPTQTADGKFIVYASGNPARSGVWRIRSDGTEDTPIAKGAMFIPDVSPDGRYVSYGVTDASHNRTRLLVSEVATGREVFSTDVRFLGYQSVVQPARARWMPDGRTLVFIGTDDGGRGVVFSQDFRPGADTTASRRLLVGMSHDSDIETLGVAPDGRHITVGRIELTRSLNLAEGVPGLP